MLHLGVVRNDRPSSRQRYTLALESRGSAGMIGLEVMSWPSKAFESMSARTLSAASSKWAM
jgi:hypothetical protein